MKSNLTDKDEIQALIASQFKSLNWSPTHSADWLIFETGFGPDALLFPAARPVRALSVESFRDRMERLRIDGRLASFAETLGPIEIRVFGQVAVAIAGCEMTENEQTITRDISVFMLVKDEKIWKIIAQGWDIVEDFQSFH
jgi:hypothetical protein